MERDNLRRFFSYRATQLQGLVEAVRDLVNHKLTKGVEAELALADLLRAVLPLRFSAGKGFLIDTCGRQSRELDLVVVDSINTARLFDFRAFEIVPIEAALACIEIKTVLTKSDLDDTFEKFQSIQEMEFFTERIVVPWSRPTREAGISFSTTSRPELVLFAYETSLSDKAIAEVYQRHPALGHAKICVLTRGIVGDLIPEGLCWVIPDEDEQQRHAGQVMALFLFQYLLPALFGQRKGHQFYVKYLEGRSFRLPISEQAGGA